MIRMSTILATAGLLAAAFPLSAQTVVKKRSEIPKAQRPPAGMCRIWLDGVPARQQPAPTDCATAIRHRPPKARVVFGEPVDMQLFDREVPAQWRDSQPPVKLKIDRTLLPQRRDSQPPLDRTRRPNGVGKPDRVQQRTNPRMKTPVIRRRGSVRRDTSSATPSALFHR